MTCSSLVGVLSRAGAGAPLAVRSPLPGAGGSPAGKFDFSFQRGVKKTVIEHLGQLDFLHAKECIVALGPPGTGKSHLAIAFGIRACLAGHRVRFATATEWVARLADAKRDGRLEPPIRQPLPAIVRFLLMVTP